MIEEYRLLNMYKYFFLNNNLHQISFFVVVDLFVNNQKIKYLVQLNVIFFNKYV